MLDTMGKTYIHFVNNADEGDDDDEIIFRQFSYQVPRVGDLVKFGGELNEHYKAISVVWDYAADGPYVLAYVEVKLVND